MWGRGVTLFALKKQSRSAILKNKGNTKIVDDLTIKKYKDALVGSEIRGVGKVSGVSNHAIERMIERTFTSERVKYILKFYNISFPGTSKEGAVIYMLDDEYVAVGKNNKIIATVVRR